MVVIAAVISACGPRRAPTSATVTPRAEGEAKLAPVAPAPSVAAVLDPRRARDDLPRVVRRLVAEERREVDDMQVLARTISDRSGRARAIRETDDVDRELCVIEAALDDSGTQESERLDHTMNELATLTTRIEMLHELLRAATIGATAVSLSQDR